MKPKWDFDYIKTKESLCKNYDKNNLLSLNCCVGEKDVYQNRTEMEISDKKSTRKKLLQLTKTLA